MGKSKDRKVVRKEEWYCVGDGIVKSERVNLEGSGSVGLGKREKRVIKFLEDRKELSRVLSWNGGLYESDKYRILNRFNKRFRVKKRLEISGKVGWIIRYEYGDNRKYDGSKEKLSFWDRRSDEVVSLGKWLYG